MQKSLECVKILFSFDERKRISFEVKTMSLYFDFKPYLEKYVAEIVTRDFRKIP